MFSYLALLFSSFFKLHLKSKIWGRRENQRKYEGELSHNYKIKSLRSDSTNEKHVRMNAMNAKKIHVSFIVCVVFWLMNAGRYEEKELYLQEQVFTRERLLVVGT